jgi:hypothetical protein
MASDDLRGVKPEVCSAEDVESKICSAGSAMAQSCEMAAIWRTEVSMHRTRLAETIARVWNQNDITYALIHGLEDYPSAIGRDLDVLINKTQIDRALSLAINAIKEYGWPIVVQPPSLYGKRLVAISADHRSSLEIHTTDRLRWATATLTGKPEPRSCKGPFRLDPWASVTKRILLPLLKGDVDRFRRRPQEIQLTSDERSCLSRLDEVTGERFACQFKQTLNSEDLDTIIPMLSPLRKRLILYSMFHAAQMVGNVGRLLQQKLLYVFYPCGPIIAIVGPEGVGKSTTVSELQQVVLEVFTKVQVRHGRPGLLPALFVQAFPRPRRSGLLTWLKCSYYLLDYWLGYWLKDTKDSSRQQLILYDQYALDVMADWVSDEGTFPKVGKLLRKFIPKPDTVILLCGSPESIVTRRPGLPQEEVARQLQSWLTLAGEGKVDAIIQTDGPLEEIVRRVNDLIIDAFVEKNGGNIVAAIGPSVDEGLVPIR